MRIVFVIALGRAFRHGVCREVARKAGFRVMRTPELYLSTAFLILTTVIPAAGQSSPMVDGQRYGQSALSSSAPSAPPNPGTAAVAPAVQQLLNFSDSEVKFDLRSLMDTLRDRRHEGWVLAAYPDPKTTRPLIGAGFSLDLPEREHPQRDPLNPHPFLEPSSAELWQAAGLDKERLQRILNQYDENLAAWSKRRYRKKIGVLAPQITNEEAISLLRVSAIQSIYNAKAYCRNFDRLTESQQIALSQLVYQMGVNLEEFDQFLSLINSSGSAAEMQTSAEADAQHWKSVQQSLIQSQWARHYRVRAVSVIAMFDPQYLNNPRAAEQQVGAILHPAVVHQRRRRSAASLRVASYNGHSGGVTRKKRPRGQNKRGA
jgi:hypothetical protein